MQEETQRVDAVIKSQFTGLSRRQIEEALESGLVIDSDGNRIKKGDRLPPARVQLRRLAEQLASIGKGNPELRFRILDQDPDVVVVEKPVGVACTPQSLLDNQSLTAWALARFSGLKKDFPDPQPTVTPFVIETEVKGIVLVAKHGPGFHKWRERYEQKQITLSYFAWCWGEPKPHRFFISTPLGRVPGDDAGEGERWAVPTPEMKMSPPPKDAVTVVRVDERLKRPGEKGFFLAEITVASGVPHQVRVHLAHQGYPVMGDKLYDAQYAARPFSVTGPQLILSELKHGDQVAKIGAEAFRKQGSSWP